MSTKTTSIPITERRNPITTDIDVSTPKQIVQLLNKCDLEIFDGWGEFTDSQNLSSPCILKRLTLLQEKVKEIFLKDNSFSASSKVGIVISGCGTSGRLAFSTVWNFKKIFGETLKKKPNFSLDYIIAGGDKALFTSQEIYEDDPQVGAEVLKRITADKKRVLYIGISCGLSAPFVAGQIDFCLNNLNKFIPVLIGFNPANLARANDIEKWSKRSFLDLIEKYEKIVLEGRAFLVNPVLGPEAICGSSRLKGGSATKILLGIIITGAFCDLGLSPSKKLEPEKWIQIYKEISDEVYKQKDFISEIVELAGHALNFGGHIYYLGEKGLGITGLIDASECPPTFGANIDDLRAFLSGGYETLNNVEGDLSKFGQEYDISLDHFWKDISPNLTNADVIICLIQDSNTEFIKPFFSFLKCKVVLANFFSQDKNRSPFLNDSKYKTLNFKIPFIELESRLENPEIKQLQSSLFYEFAAKHFLNIVSTGSHILKGKIFKNLMVDMKPSNNKLFCRSLEIIQEFSGISRTKSLEFLLRSIYETDNLNQNLMTSPVEVHIRNSFGKTKIVPIALLASLKNSSIQKAKKILQEEPKIRNAIFNSFN